MEQDKLINELKELGFNEYKAKVFLSLSKGKLMTASEIVKDTKIIRGSIYDILYFFVERGYCNQIETDRILQFQIIDPDIIVDKIQRDYNFNFMQKISHLRNTFKKVKRIYDLEIPDENKFSNIELIRGYNKNRTAKFIELLKQAKKEILFMVRFEMYVSKELDADAKKFIKNGGVIKSIYEASLNFRIIDRNENVSIPTMDGFIDLCRYYEKYGEQLRISQLELPNITIFDKEMVFINIDNKNIPKHNRADIIIRNPDFAKRLIDLFNYYWSQGYTTKDFKKVHKNLNIKKVISK